MSPRHGSSAGGLVYRRLMYDLVDNLRDLRDFADKLGMHELGGTIASELEGLEDHTFRLAVVGEFKRGKSTFINALLGSHVLPADILPTSATLNRITYGISPSASLTYHDGDTAEIPVDALVDHVTKLTPEAEARSRSIAEAVVRYPVPFCRNNTDVYDTPGLADEARMTAITMGILPNVDAAILVIMGDSPFSKSEAEFLDTLFDRGLRRVIVVVTGMDRIRRGADKERLLDAIRTRIEARINSYASQRFEAGSTEAQAFLRENGTPEMFPVSGLDALEAKLAANEEALERSGFPQLERFLERFLTEQADSLSLRRRLSKVVQWCDLLSTALELQSGDLPLDLEQLKARHRQLLALMDVVQAMLSRELEALEAGGRAMVYGPLEKILTRQIPSDLRTALQRGVKSINLSAKQLADKEHLQEAVADALVHAQDFVARHHAKAILGICLPKVVQQRRELAPHAITADRIMLHVRSSGTLRKDKEAAPTRHSLARDLACHDFPMTVLRRSNTDADMPTAPDEHAAVAERLVSALCYTRRQLTTGQDSSTIQATLVAPPAGNFFARTTWDMTAPGAFKKAVASQAVATIDRLLESDPLGERALQFLQTLQNDTLASLSTFLSEMKDERVAFTLQEQRHEVMLEQMHRDMDRMRTRLERIKGHAESVGRELM